MRTGKITLHASTNLNSESVLTDAQHLHKAYSVVERAPPHIATSCAFFRIIGYAVGANPKYSELPNVGLSCVRADFGPEIAKIDTNTHTHKHTSHTSANNRRQQLLLYRRTCILRMPSSKIAGHMHSSMYVRPEQSINCMRSLQFTKNRIVRYVTQAHTTTHTDSTGTGFAYILHVLETIKGAHACA